MTDKRTTTLPQWRIKAGAIDAAVLGPFKKQAHGHGRGKQKSSLCWLQFLWLVQFREVIKTVATGCHI